MSDSYFVLFFWAESRIIFNIQELQGLFNLLSLLLFLVPYKWRKDHLGYKAGIVETKLRTRRGKLTYCLLRKCTWPMYWNNSQWLWADYRNKIPNIKPNKPQCQQSNKLFDGLCTTLRSPGSLAKPCHQGLSKNNQGIKPICGLMFHRERTIHGKDFLLVPAIWTSFRDGTHNIPCLSSLVD